MPGSRPNFKIPWICLLYQNIQISKVYKDYHKLFNNRWKKEIPLVSREEYGKVTPECKDTPSLKLWASKASICAELNRNTYTRTRT